MSSLPPGSEFVLAGLIGILGWWLKGFFGKSEQKFNEVVVLTTQINFLLEDLKSLSDEMKEARTQLTHVAHLKKEIERLEKEIHALREKLNKYG